MIAAAAPPRGRLLDGWFTRLASLVLVASSAWSVVLEWRRPPARAAWLTAEAAETVISDEYERHCPATAAPGSAAYTAYLNVRIVRLTALRRHVASLTQEYPHVP